MPPHFLSKSEFHLYAVHNIQNHYNWSYFIPTTKQNKV